MAKESNDSGLSSEQSETSRLNYPTQLSLPLLRQHSASVQSSQLLSRSIEQNFTEPYAVVNSSDYRMSAGVGANPSNDNNGQNPPPSTTAAAAKFYPRFPMQMQQVPPRVHFGDTKGRPRFRYPSDSTGVRAPRPFIRSFSFKAFDIPDGPSPSSLPRPSSPQNDVAHHQRETLLDKGIQCEPEIGVAQRSQTHSNPLLSALLAAASATVNNPPSSSELDSTNRKKTQFRTGALPYWSDSEINAYDSLDTFNAASQNSVGIVGGNKPYPSASVVAAAATAAAMALAAVQSTSRGPPVKSLEQPLTVPISRANLQLEELTPEAATMRSLTGQFADASLYTRFPTNVDQRKSVNFDATTVHKPEMYGNIGLDIAHFTSQAPPNTLLLDKNSRRLSTAPHYVNELPSGQSRYTMNEEPTVMPHSHPIPDNLAGSSHLPLNFNSSQFSFLSSEPYPNPSHRNIVPSQSPVHETPTRYRINPQMDGNECTSDTCGGGLLVVNVIAGSGLKTAQMPLRDLYCVLETDSIRKARSMIRTDTDYFEWDEVFEMEIEGSRFLSILIYQWDARTRHRLCFYGGIDLTTLSQRHLTLSPSREKQKLADAEDDSHPLTSPLIARSGMRFEKIALQLEPRGVLFLQMGFLSMSALYTRRNLSTAYETAVFGVSLEELIYRDRMLAGLGVVSDSVVPLLIRKCVEEVDRRGTEVVGIYRLSGSVWMKLQVRDLFTRTAEKIAQGLIERNEKVVRGALAGLDLSPEAVPDIHAITATMKDFFRELPEPLFTNTLYPMVYEATQVAGPRDSHMGTKLMLNILDCLPTSNQEVLLYLLDHLKRITNKSTVNKMNSHNLAVCLAPCLLHPSPAAARDMDAGLLNPSKMASVLECILDIWP